MAIEPSSYFAANPDVAEAYKQNNMGMTPAEYVQTHYDLYGSKEGRLAPAELQPQTYTSGNPFNDAMAALQSGQATVKWANFDLGEGNSYSAPALFDAQGRMIEGLGVAKNPDGSIVIGTPGDGSNYLHITTQVTPQGTIAPVQSQDQLKYVSKGNDRTNILAAGAALMGAPFLSQGIGALTGLTGANLAGATGATLGGLTAAATGNDVLKGALLGGAGGYLTSALGSGVTDQNTLQAAYDADVAAGMVPEFGTNAAYDSFMQNAMTPAARAAIEQQIADSSVGGLSYQDILNQGNTITDIAAGKGMGPFTAEELGQQFQDYMSQGGYQPVSVTTPSGTATASAANEPTTASTGSKGLDSTLASTAVSSLAKLLPGLLTAGALGQMSSNKPSVGALPTQGTPSYSPEYYQAIQQYYNTYMPEQPRDVATPLQQWYDSKYGA